MKIKLLIIPNTCLSFVSSQKENNGLSLTKPTNTSLYENDQGQTGGLCLNKKLKELWLHYLHNDDIEQFYNKILQTTHVHYEISIIHDIERWKKKILNCAQQNGEHNEHKYIYIYITEYSWHRTRWKIKWKIYGCKAWWAHEHDEGHVVPNLAKDENKTWQLL